MNKDILQILQGLSDEKYKKFTAALLPKQVKMLGVRLPQLRALAREIAKNKDWRAFLNGDESSLYEEQMLRGIIIATADCEFCERKKYAEKFVKKIDSWGICDSFCASFKLKKSDREEMFAFILKCHKSSKEYERRFAIVMMLMHYLDATHIREVLKTLTSVDNASRTTQMATAWALCTCYIKYPDATKEEITKSGIDEKTLKMTLQKMRDSYRISDAEKQKTCEELKKHAKN